MSGQRSLCRGPALLSGRLCVGARQSLCRGRGPGALCVGPQRLCRGPSALYVGAGALCVGPRHSFGVCALSVLTLVLTRLCRGPALFVSGSGTVVYVGPGALSRPGLSQHSRGALWGPSSLRLRRAPALCRAPVLSVEVCSGGTGRSSPNARCVRPRRSLSLGVRRCRAPALSVSGSGALLCRSPTGALCRGLHRRGPAVLPTLLCREPALIRVPPMRPHVCCGPPAQIPLASSAGLGPSSACHPSRPTSPQLRSGCGPPAQIRVPPIQPGGFPFQERTPNLT